jgi:hypothetical protein
MARDRVAEAIRDYITPPINRRRLPKVSAEKSVSKSEAFGQTMYGYYRTARNKKGRIR